MKTTLALVLRLVEPGNLVFLVIFGSNVKWFVEGDSNQFPIGPVIADGLIVRNVEPRYYRLRGSKQSQQAKQDFVWLGVLRQGVLDVWPEQLLEEVSWRPSGRNVIQVRLCAELRVERQGYLGLVNEVVHRILRVGLIRRVNPPLQTNLAHARDNAAGTQVQFVARVTGYALFRCSRRGPVHGLLIRTGCHALPIATTARLVYQHYAIFRPLVDGIARTCGEAARVSAVVAGALQVEHPHVMLRQLRAASELPCGSIFVDVGMRPVFVSGQMTQDPLAGRDILEDSLSGVGIAAPGLRPKHIQEFDIPVMRIAAVWLRLHVVPPHSLLALTKRPGVAAGHRTRLAPDAPVDVKYDGKLLVWPGSLVGILHFPVQMPVEHLWHCLDLLLDAFTEETPHERAMSVFTFIHNPLHGYMETFAKRAFDVGKLHNFYQRIEIAFNMII